jgi:hypothetical protein
MYCWVFGHKRNKLRSIGTFHFHSYSFQFLSGSYSYERIYIGNTPSPPPRTHDYVLSLQAQVLVFPAVLLVTSSAWSSRTPLGLDSSPYLIVSISSNLLILESWIVHLEGGGMLRTSSWALLASLLELALDRSLMPVPLEGGPC